jgi:hypothetical protein
VSILSRELSDGRGILPPDTQYESPILLQLDNTRQFSTMTDVEKPTQIMTEDTAAAKGDINGFSEQENAVGYKEYREALSIEVSDKEVRCL